MAAAIASQPAKWRLLLFLLRVQDFLAGFAKRFMLLVQTGNDTATAGRGAAAVMS
jgi:hypothetical protein